MKNSSLVKSAKASKTDFEATLQRYKEIIDSRLKAFFEERILEADDFLKSVYSQLKDYVLRGGKRLRPILTIMAFKAAGDDDEEKILAPAVGIELFHNSSLIHDDIMDEDSERRGMLSMHEHFEKLFLNDHQEKRYGGRIFRKMSERFGVSMAILQGDILYALTERCFTRSPFGADHVRKALDVLHHTYRVISEGQMLDILSEMRKDAAEDHYLRVIEAKTSQLFKAAVQVGAIFGRATERQFNALSRYAFSLGTAFQLQDDLMDIDPGLQGRAFGSDIRRGKFTLLMIKAFASASPRQKRSLLAALGNDQADRGTIQAAVDVLHAAGAVDEVHGLALQKLQEGRSALTNAGLSKEAGAFFEGLARFMAQREIWSFPGTAAVKKIRRGRPSGR